LSFGTVQGEPKTIELQATTNNSVVSDIAVSEPNAEYRPTNLMSTKEVWRTRKQIGQHRRDVEGVEAGGVERWRDPEGGGGGWRGTWESSDMEVVDIS
jgi:hypothetical protein